MATQQAPRTPGRPGAMTMAMQAVKTVQGPKVLRIGVIQGGKIIDERIIRDRGTVSVGTNERNTFTVVAPDFPSHFDLFQMAGGSYKLNFTDTMEGRIAMPQGVMSLPQLKQSGQATRNTVGWQVPLNEQCRGKVSVGDVTLLFQFVPPPPPQPKPQLPAAIQASSLKNIDWTYAACFAFLLLCLHSVGFWYELAYDPEIDESIGGMDARIVALVQPPTVQEPEPTPTTTDNNTPSNEPSQTPTPTEHHETHAASNSPAAVAARAEHAAAAASSRAERAAAAALSALQNSAEFAALTGATDTGAGSAADRLASGGLMTGSVDALANTGGVANASANGGLTRRGLSASAGGIAGSRGLGSSGTVSSGPEVSGGGGPAPERIPHGEARVETGEVGDGEGQLDANAVAGVLRRNIGGIRSCYERALRNNPTLSGRLEVRFNIGTSGRVTGSPSASGLSAAPEVGSCVSSRIRSLVFPAPTGGSVEFSFPFNFQPGG